MSSTATKVETLGDAIVRYQWVCEQLGYQIIQPANTSEQLEDGTWELENGNGPLARVRPDGRVIFPRVNGESVTWPKR